jgi:hypothetical protein
MLNKKPSLGEGTPALVSSRFKEESRRQKAEGKRQKALSILH